MIGIISSDMKRQTSFLALALATLPLAAQDWTTMGGDQGRTGFVDFTLGEANFLPAWSRDDDGERSFEPATIVGDRVFLVPRRGFDFGHKLEAFSLSEGTLLWKKEYPRIFLSSQPTYFDGRLYLLTSDRRDFSHLRALDATTGETTWEHRFVNHRGAPCPVIANESGIWLNGGSSAGMYRFSLAGSEQLFVPQQLNYTKTPSWGNDQPLSWVDDHFTAHDPASGEVQWSLPDLEGGTGFGRPLDYPVVTDSEAFVIDSDGDLICIDLATREIRWESDQAINTSLRFSFKNLPSVAGDQVFAMTNNQVVTFDVTTGALDRVYLSPEFIDTRQALVLRDHFVVSNRTRTFVIERESGELAQDLLFGGTATFGNEHLVIVDPAGEVNVFRADSESDLPKIVLPDLIEDQPYRTQLSAVHLDLTGDLTYQAVGPPPFLNVTPSGEVRGFLSSEPITDEVILTVLISNGEDPPVTETFPIKIIAQNDRPVIFPFRVDLVEDGPAKEIPIADIISDEDTPLDDLTLIFSGRLPPDRMFPFITDFTEKNLVFGPRPNRSGQFTIGLTVAQPGGGATNYIVPITISPRPDSPEILAPIPDQNLNFESPVLTLDLSDYFSDPDPDDSLTYSISENSNEALFETAVISGNELALDYAPFANRNATLTVLAEDLTGRTVSQSFRVTGPNFPDLVVSPDPIIRLNRRTGLFEQTITVTSPAGRPAGGLQLTVNDLGEDYQLLGANDKGIEIFGALEPDAATTIVLEYYSATTRTPPAAQVTATSILPQEPSPIFPSPGLPAAISQMGDGSILLEFLSEPDKSYVIEYSCDLQQWFPSGFSVTATNNRTLWLDQGLPKTSSHPRTCPARYYRIREMPGDFGP